MMLWQPRGLIQPNRDWRRPQGGAAAAVDITFTDSSVITTDLTTYTFSTQAFGAEAADRKVVVGVGFRAGSGINFSSVTIGGVTATLVVNTPTGINQDHAAIYIADVPTGTTGDVVVTLTAGASRCGIGVWRMTGAASSTATDSESSQTDAETKTLTISANGGGVGYGLAITAPGTATWTGLTEDFDEVVEATITHSGAHLNSVGGGDISVSIDWSGSPTNIVSSFASWAP